METLIPIGWQDLLGQSCRLADRHCAGCRHVGAGGVRAAADGCRVAVRTEAAARIAAVGCAAAVGAALPARRSPGARRACDPAPAVDLVRAAGLQRRRKPSGPVAPGREPGSRLGADPAQLAPGTRRAVGARGGGHRLGHRCAQHRGVDRPRAAPAGFDGGADRQFPAQRTAGAEGRGDARRIRLDCQYAGAPHRTARCGASLRSIRRCRSWRRNW